MGRKRKEGPRPKRPSVAARMKAAGKVPVQLWITHDDIALLNQAMKKEGEYRYLTQFLAGHGKAAAEKILEEKGKSS